MRFDKPKHALSLARDVAALRRRLLGWRPDLVHSHGSQDTWTTVFANRFGGPRLPHVLTRHNSKRVTAGAANRWLYGRAIDLLVVVSRGVLERYEEFFRRGILDAGSVPVIPSSIDFPRYDVPLDRDGARRELGAEAAAPVIAARITISMNATRLTPISVVSTTFFTFSKGASGSSSGTSASSSWGPSFGFSST